MAEEKEYQVKVQNVWASNLSIEFDHIVNNVGIYPFASIKCKYPLHSSRHFLLKNFNSAPEKFYDNLKTHIMNLPIIQLGLTLFNTNQELPTIEGRRTIWLFHFNMSDSCYFPKSLLSKASLERVGLYGVDLEMNRKDGVDRVVFRDVVISSGFLKKVSGWVSFMGMYDFGCLVKMFMGEGVFPERMEEFLEKRRLLFGEVCDVSEGLKGTFLEEVEGGDERERNAGFDSYLTMLVYIRMKMRHDFSDGMVDKFSGLEIS